MITTNPTLDALHALKDKKPLFLIHIDGKTTDYCNRRPGSPTYTLKRYLPHDGLKGLSQSVTPEECRSAIGGVKFTLEDINDEITALIGADPYQLQNLKVTIKIGYDGMDETDLISFVPGWIADIDLTSNGLGYLFDVADPKKKMQKKIFRGAETSTVYVQGNPINIALWILTSTGAGTNGDYDIYPAAWGIAIPESFINISNLEDIRDTYFPSSSHYMKFTITEKIMAKDFLEKEILKPLRIYMVTRASGELDFIPYKPSLPTLDNVQSFTKANIIGLPSFKGNFKGVVNEVDFHHSHNGSIFQTEEHHVAADSLLNRDPGKKPVTIKSKGLHESHSPGSIPSKTSEIVLRRVQSIFLRYATPPPLIAFKTLYTQWLSEAGDIVPFEHENLPDLETGLRGLADKRLEILDATPDWSGMVNFKMLDTGFDRDQYAVICPTMVVISGTSQTIFDVSAADAAKYQVGWIVDIYADHYQPIATNLEITDITGTQITVGSAIGQVPVAGDIVEFSTYYNCIADQRLFWFISPVLSDGLVGCWPFDEGEGTIAKDTSGNGNDGSGAGTIKFVDGVSGKAIEADGTGNPIEVTSLSTDLQNAIKTGDFSISFWWEPNSEADFTDIISFDTNAGVNRIRFEHGNDDATKAGYWFGHSDEGSGNQTIFKNALIPYGERHHFVVMFDRTTGYLSAYIDGVLDQSAAKTLATYTSATKLTFFDGGTNLGDILDECRIYNRALIQDEITFLYENPGPRMLFVP